MKHPLNQKLRDLLWYALFAAILLLACSCWVAIFSQ